MSQEWKEFKVRLPSEVIQGLAKELDLPEEEITGNEIALCIERTLDLLRSMGIVKGTGGPTGSGGGV